MSEVIIKKNGTDYPLLTMPNHYPADRVYLDGDTTKTVQDKCARKADLTNLDLTGTTNTTGSTIASGTYFYLNGVLVRAKTAIASGATFTENTNYEVVTVGDALKEENFNLIKINSADTINSERCVRIGKVVYISGVVTFGSAKTGSPIRSAKIPSEYAPSFNVPIYACDDTNDKVGNGQIFASGGEYMIDLYRPSSDTSTSVSKVRFFGVYVQA